MPTSLVEHVPQIIRWCEAVAPKRVLDVGPGRGKYGALLREYLPNAIVDAVEMEPSYITPRLEALYDTIYPCDVRQFGQASLDSYDLVLLIDVIEHLTHDDGFTLIDRIAGRAIVCTPMHFFQNPETVPSEVHRSLWTWADFESTGRVEANATQYAGYLVLLGPRP